MIAVVDYGAGNLFSIANALHFLRVEFDFAKSPDELGGAGGILLPGVGAFPRAAQMLRESGFFDVLQETRLPLLGICLGMQLLFERSEEFGCTEGLGRIPGRIVRLEGEVNIPHMGWNSLKKFRDSPLTEGVADGAYVYFVHSYRAVCPEEYIVSACEYGQTVPGVVQNGEVYGCQFHPEKSGRAGLAMLRSFDALCRREGEQTVPRPVTHTDRHGIHTEGKGREER